MKIINSVEAPKPTKGGRPGGNDFSGIPVGGAGYLNIPEGVEAGKFLDRVKGQVTRWKKADESRSAMKFTVALAVAPDDALGTQTVGVFRTA